MARIYFLRAINSKTHADFVYWMLQAEKHR